ncbi:hypothetical protein WA016_01061 [Myxococcus stipitatus]
MKKLLLPLLMSSMACTQATPPSEPAATAQRRDAVLTDAQLGDAWTDPPVPYRTVSLTFDDGPDDNPSSSFNTSWMIADYLRQQGIRATFFINGCRIDGSCPRFPNDPGNTTYLSELVRMGHRVASHTYKHDALPSQTPAQQIAALKVNQDILDPYITDGMYLFRAPGDNWGQSPIGGIDACGSASVVANSLRSEPALSKLSGPFCFDWDAHDWVCTDNHWTPEACADNYIGMGAYLDPTGSRTVNGLERGIIQMHDLSPSPGYGGTDWAYLFVVSLVEKLKAMPGTPYVFVPLDAYPGVRGMFSFPSPTPWTTTYLSDADNWNNDVGYYGTIRLGDINGDGKADVCGRGGSGLRCAVSKADGSMDTEALWLSTVSDMDGYKPAQYSTTFQLADIDHDGKADACIRGGAGYMCYRSLGTSFSPSPWLASEFSDANGWGGSEARHGSIRVGNVDGDANGYGDVCGRNATGQIVCSLFNGSGFSAATTWSTAFTASMWDSAQYATTFQLGDLNADGKADLCVRGPDGIRCGRSSGTRFATPTIWTQMAFDNAQGWGTSAARYKSIKLGDVDGDGRADVCGRHSTGLVCAFSTSTAFNNYRYVTNTHFGDAQGWSAEEYGSTLMLGDVNGDGRADLCARASTGLSCAMAPALLATYDATLKTGRCSTAQPSCDSGMFYEGRGTMHPEAQHPNTLNNSCADGSSVSLGYLKDASIERVRVMTVDRSTLAAGKTVRVEVSARASGAGEQLEIFTASNAASPTWVSLGTTSLPSAGFAWVTKTYTLPSGAQQAVRAVIRATSLSGSCPGGGFTDVDDLAFTVQ